ncbi:MAG: hypothetical protein KBG22_09005 [Smithella sp.]|nr:hypothetical protein [Smithella sp.]
MSKLHMLSDSHSFTLTPFRAVLIIVLLIASILYGLAVCRSHPYIEGKKPKDADLKCYQNIVERIHAGESYYSAAGDELRRFGFTTASVFNWRLPALAWLLGQFPSLKTGQIIAFMLAITTLMLWLMVFHQNQYAVWQVFLGGLILSGPVIYSLLPGPFLAHEFWAGTLIALSLALHALGWRYASVIVGLTALFLRELSLPFVFVMMILALLENQRREALLWFAGILIFGVELLMHWSIVSKLITENDKVLQGGWIVFGGWPFVLDTAQMHPFFLLLPPWVVAIILPLSLLGLACWGGTSGLRIACTVGIYVLAFMIVGRSFNIYWGLMYAFVMPLGLLHVPQVLGKLWKQFRR